jgi:hypothetical protein
VVCTNGAIASRRAIPAYGVPHRGDVVQEVIRGAIKISEQVDYLAGQGRWFERRRMANDEE